MSLELLVDELSGKNCKNYCCVVKSILTSFAEFCRLDCSVYHVFLLATDALQSTKFYTFVRCNDFKFYGLCCDQGFA